MRTYADVCGRMLTYADVCRWTRRRGDALAVRVLVLNAMLPVALAGVRSKKLCECCGTSSYKKKYVVLVLTSAKRTKY
jgi:hypothetical protein